MVLTGDALCRAPGPPHDYTAQAPSFDCPSGAGTRDRGSWVPPDAGSYNTSNKIRTYGLEEQHLLKDESRSERRARGTLSRRRG